MRQRTALLLTVLALLAVAACGDDDDDDSAPSTTTTTSTTPGEPEISATVDWRARTVELEGDVAFGVEFCEGDAPMLCITSSDGNAIGAIERLSFDAVGDLEQWAEDFYGSIAADRKQGCDPGYELAADRPAPALFAGVEGIRYGFIGKIDGEVVEHVVGYAAERDGKLDLLAANAFGENFCVERVGELAIEVMTTFEPVLAAIAEGSTPP